MKIALCGFSNQNFMDFLSKNYEFKYFDVYQMDDFSALNDFDVILYYVITGLPTKIPLENLAVEIKKQVQKPMLGFFDYEVTKHYDSFWKKTLDAMDRILFVGPIDKYIGWHNQHIQDKCRFFPLPLEFHPLKPTESEKRWVAVMHHTSPWADMGFALHMLAELNMPVKWFTGWHGVNSETQLKIAQLIGLKDVKVYPRLEGNEYLKELSECYIGFDHVIGYVGWSRFVTECAMFGIPVITDDYVSSNMVANPSLVLNNEGAMMLRIQELYHDPEKRNQLGLNAQRTLIHTLSYKESKFRLDKIISEVIKP